MKIGVLGAGSWGTTLAILAAESGHPVTLHARAEEKARSMQRTRQNEVYLPGALLPEGVQVTSDLTRAVADQDLLVFAVPCKAMHEVAARVAEIEGAPSVVVSAAKGFERSSLRTMSAVLQETFGPDARVAVLSGPNLAREIADGQPTGTVVASDHAPTAEFIQKALNCKRFRAYTSSDVVGVELAGALKNVMALATGMLAELGFGANAQATLLTRGLAEMARLGAVLGARVETFRGLAGMGDLLATCTSPLSRNYRAGRMAARGVDPEAIRQAMGQVVEGLNTAQVAVHLGDENGVELPITAEVHRVLFEGKSAKDGARALMSRPPRAEDGEEG